MPKEVNNEPRRYWPFHVLPSDKQTPLHQVELHFLETAYRKGYRPYTCGAGDFGAATKDRTALIVSRGRGRWEVILGLGDAKAASAFVDDFACAADAVLEWLAESRTADILARVQDHLVTMPGAAHSFVVDAVPKIPALV